MLEDCNAPISALGLSGAQRPACCASQTIDELCEECAALIEHHEKIQLLSLVHGNLRKTLVDVENIAELPQEASAAEDLLQDNSRLLEVRPLVEIFSESGFCRVFLVKSLPLAVLIVWGDVRTGLLTPTWHGFIAKVFVGHLAAACASLMSPFRRRGSLQP